MARSEPAVAAELVARLRSGSDAVQLAAGASLEEAGPAIGEPLIEEAIGLLRELARTDVTQMRPLASLGRDREDVLEEVLALAAPRPPRITRIQYGKSSFYEQDEVMWERGAAIDGLGYFTKFPERVVPMLADALETFEEYDPDWSYKGEHERVTAALRSFGAAAKAAVPRLARHLWQSDGQVDQDVVRLLGEMGPAAEEALPALQEVETVLRNLDPGSWEPLNPPDPEYDGPTWAIWRIRGGGL